MLPHPPKSLLPEVPEHAAVLRLLDDVLITAAQLAVHWGYTDTHLSNIRRGDGRGLPFIKLPTGGIRYRMSEILASEIAGTAGPVTLDRVCIAIASCTAVAPADRARIVEHLTAAFRKG